MKYKLFIIDVDGTMTDGGIYYGENREEWKKFCTKDAAGFFAVHESGAKTMVLTGRKCQATQRVCRLPGRQLQGSKSRSRLCQFREGRARGCQRHSGAYF